MKSAYKRNLKRQLEARIINRKVSIATEIGRHGKRVIACIRRVDGPPVYIARPDPTGTSMSEDTLCDHIAGYYERVAWQ